MAWKGIVCGWKVRTNIPRSARTVSLLESFALRSPTSPTPLTGVAKWRVMAAFEPPAAIPQSARHDELRHKAARRRPGIGYRDNEGDNVSRMMAASLRTSAKKR